MVTGRRQLPEVHSFTITVARAQMLVTARERAAELTGAVVMWSAGPSHMGVSIGKGDDRRRYQLIQLA